jgi:hypothetical protein
MKNKDFEYHPLEKKLEIARSYIISTSFGLKALSGNPSTKQCFGPCGSQTYSHRALRSRDAHFFANGTD